MEPEDERASVRRLAWTVFALLLALYVATSPGTVTGIDATVRWRVARAMWTEGTISLGDPADPAVRAFGHVVHRGPDGRAYTHFGPGQSLVLVPFDVVARLLGPRLRPGAPEHGERLVLALTAFPLVSAALGGVLVLLLHALGAAPGRAALCAALAGAGTTLLPHAQAHQEEPLVALVIALAALALARARGRFPARAAALAAGVAALGFVVRPTFVVPYAALLGLGLLEVRRHGGARGDAVRLALAFGAAGLVALAGWLLYDHARFGDALETGYGIALREGLAAGVWTRPSWPAAFLAPLVSPGKGVLVFSPALALGLVGLARGATPPGLRALGAAGLLMLVASAALGALTPWWGGDWTWGPRLQVHAVAFVLAPAAAVLGGEALPRRAVLALVVASLAVQALAATFAYNLEYLDRAPRGTAVWSPAETPLAARVVHVARLVTGRAVLAGPPPDLGPDEVRVASTLNVFPARIAARAGWGGAALAALALWLVAVAAAVAAARRLRRLAAASP